MVHPAHSHALTSAGIDDPELRASYQLCRQLAAEHGKTYYLATWLLPPAKRPHVWALYGFARWADEFVDSMTHPDPEGLLVWGKQALDDLVRGQSDDPVVKATAHTVRSLDLDVELFETFLASMRMDITVTAYPTFAELQRYTRGSAMVIGLMMLPVLGPLTTEAAAPAEALGEAFQLTNFIRDVPEDLARGRIYLPQEDLDRYGVTRADLVRGVVTEPVRRLLAFEVDRTRALYERARPGVALVEPASRPCLRTAIELYGGILDEVERAGYDVFRSRLAVPNRRRASVAVPAWVSSLRARRDAARWRQT
ncbi:MAG: phytoene/squalene synthase family protein [Actinomycetales bacterium]